MTDPTRLIACLAEIERHVGNLGWDQPARLFALVSTKELLEMEPQLVGRVPEGTDDALSSIEQDDFHATDSVFSRLREIYFPETVEGAALAMEQVMLPEQYRDTVPEDDEAAAEFVRTHPERIDVRVVAGVLRDGTQHGLVRLKTHPDDLLSGTDTVVGLPEALAETLRSEP